MNKKSYALFILLLLIETSFFYILRINKVNGLFNKYLMITILSITFIFSLKNILQSTSLFKKNIFAFIFIYIMEVIYSCFEYNQSIYSVLNISLYCLVVLLYPILAINIKNKSFIAFLKRIIIVFTLILSVLFNIQAYLFNAKNILFLNINSSNFRFNSIRIYESGNFIELGLVIVVGLLISKKNILNKKLLILTAMSAFFELFFVAKGRMGMIFILISIFIMLIFSEYKLKSILKLSIIILMIFSILSFTNILTSYKESFVSNEYSTGNSARYNEAKFYLNQVKEKPFLGMGFIKYVSEVDEAYYLLRGTDEYAYFRDDIGFIGFLNTFGLFGGLWYILLVYKALKILGKAKKANLLKYNLEILGVIVLLLLQSMNTIVMDPQRIFMLPVILVFIEHLDIQCKKIKLGVVE